MKAEIIAVGSELLTPDRLDTNSLFLTRRLNQLGVAVLRKTVVGDELEKLRDTIRDALARRCEEVLGGSLAERLASVIGIVKSSGGRAARSGVAFREASAWRHRV